EPDAAVVAVQVYVPHQVLHRAEAVLVLVGPDDLEVLPLVEDDLGPEVAHDQRDGLAVVAVGRVADQAGPGVGALPQEPHRTAPIRPPGRRAAGAPSRAAPARAAGPPGRTRRTPGSSSRSCRCRSAVPPRPGAGRSPCPPAAGAAAWRR